MSQSDEVVRGLALSCRMREVEWIRTGQRSIKSADFEGPKFDIAYIVLLLSARETAEREALECRRLLPFIADEMYRLASLVVGWRR